MRLKSKKKTFTRFNLLTVGIGLILLITLIYGSLNYRYTDINNLTYDELKSNFSTIDDKDSYDFINQIDINHYKDSLDFKKLVCITLNTDKDDYKRYLENITGKSLSISDKEYMINQISNKKLIWDKDKLIKHWLITPKDLKDIDKSGKDFWVIFREKYGNYGMHYYSKPIFNEKKNIVIIQYSSSGGWLIGSGSILVYKKTNDIWKLIDSKSLWIS